MILGLLLVSLPWTQWGGPHRNFTTETDGLAESWPASGPRKLWSRPLGEGYSSILVENGALYTMYRSEPEEIVIAADARTGKTLWEHKETVRFHNDAADRGNGPHATPLLVGDRLLVTGVTGKLLCLDKKTGKRLWSHELWDEYGGSRLIYGYACSPLAYRDLIIVSVGGTGKALAAFRQSDGSLVWRKGDAGNAYSSPILINVDGVDQVAILMRYHILAVNPLNGDLQWAVEHKASYGLNVSTLLWGNDNLLFASSAYNAGSRVLHLTRSGNTTKVQELWQSYKMHVHHGNVIRIGDAVYGSSGDFGPAPLTAVDIQTGRVLWQNRQFQKASLVYAGGKMIILDEDGNLSLATVSPQGVKTLSTVALLKNNAWTAPTLVGTHLYLRDRHEMMALDLK